ncbi:MAG: glycosyl hydrolase, partial [Chthoniobacterales bacterium]|nr:glycosyl hydrolase [Chthoniobacterales bacterium]
MSHSQTGQLLLLGVPGKNLDSETAKVFRRIQPGGFILFGRNIESPSQLRKLLDDLRDLSQKEPILTIDQEGGRVSRLRLIGNEPPSAWQLTQKAFPHLIQKHGELTGRLLRLFGFNLNLCPVLDLCLDEEADNSLRNRCYGKTVEEVVQNARLFNSAMRHHGILSCGKHFPGYTRAAVDPHEHLPLLALAKPDLEELEFAPFRCLKDELDTIMVGHIAIPSLEPDNATRPASLSPTIVHTILRQEIGFQGLIMTDDLDMGAILNFCDFESTITGALAAGCNLLMICHRIQLAEEAVKILEKSPTDSIDKALEPIETLRSKFQPPLQF